MQFKFSKKAWDYNSTRLTNQIFKLLPMYEEEEDWAAQQETILYELYGYNELFKDSADFMTLIVKLTALNSAENKFIFRKIVFEAITALKTITTL